MLENLGITIIISIISVMKMYRGYNPSKEYHEYLNTDSFGDFLPQNLLGEENQCRNNPRWPFLVSQPVCLVAHPLSGRPVLDICAVPFCASRGELQEFRSFQQPPTVSFASRRQD